VFYRISKNIIKDTNPFPMGFQSHTNLFPIPRDWNAIGLPLLFHWITMGMSMVIHINRYVRPFFYDARGASNHLTGEVFQGHHSGRPVLPY